MRALLLDTNFSSAPISAALKALGFDVCVVGNNATDCLAMSEDLWVQIDYSDEVQLYRTYRELAPDMVVPGCNDLSYQMYVKLSEHFGLDSLDNLDSLSKLHDKGCFRSLCEKLAIPVPRQWSLTELTNVRQRRLIVKPVDGFSGKGVNVAGGDETMSIEDAVAIAREISCSNAVIVEDCIEGQLSSFSAFIEDGAISSAFIAKEFGFTNRFVVDTSYVQRDDKHFGTLTEHAAAIVSELNIKAGLLHLQYIDTAQQIFLIEATRRCPGDLYSQLISLSTGFDYAGAYASAFVGVTTDSAPDLGRVVLRHTVSGLSHGTLKNLEFMPGLNILSWYPIAAVGESLSPSPGGRAGIAFCDTSLDQLDVLLEEAKHNRLVKIRYA